MNNRGDISLWRVILIISWVLVIVIVPLFRISVGSPSNSGAIGILAISIALVLSFVCFFSCGRLLFRWFFVVPSICVFTYLLTMELPVYITYLGTIHYV